MSDDNGRYVETTQQSWLSRIGEAFKGIFIGFVCIAGAAVLLWWNEGRAVLTAKGLTEGAGQVVSVPADQVNAAHEGKLVHIAGKAQSGSNLADPNFTYMTVKALILQRKVEMFQWLEEKHTKESKNVGGSVTRETTYTYKKAWASTPQDSSRFREAANHANPSSMPYNSTTIRANDVRLGAFRVPAGMLSLRDTETLSAPSSIPPAGALKSVRGQLYIGNNPDTPEVGDVRILHSYAPEQDLSLVARQSGDTFTSFSVAGGKRSIQMLRPGLLDATAMFGEAKNENAILTWILRAGGALLCIAGFYLLLRPLVVLGDVVPFIGSILNAGAGIVAFCLGLACSLVVVGIAWVFYRPLQGVILLAGAAALLGGLKMLAKKKNTPAPAVPGT